MSRTIDLSNVNVGNVTISWGTFGDNNTKNAKYNFPVVTIEAHQGAGKSRKIMFNAEAQRVLNLEVGETQKVVFGLVNIQGDNLDDIGTIIALANYDSVDTEEKEVTASSALVANVSKGRSTYVSGQEKGKAISNGRLVSLICKAMSIDENGMHEFELVEFPASGSYVMQYMSPQTATVDTVEEGDMEAACTDVEVAAEVETN